MAKKEKRTTIHFSLTRLDFGHLQNFARTLKLANWTEFLRKALAVIELVSVNPQRTPPVFEKIWAQETLIPIDLNLTLPAGEVKKTIDISQSAKDRLELMKATRSFSDEQLIRNALAVFGHICTLKLKGSMILMEGEDGELHPVKLD